MTQTAPRMWGHIELPANAVMTRRDRIRPGDIVISSHSGRRKVDATYTGGIGPDGGTTYLTLEGVSHHGPEAYPANSEIPRLHGPSWTIEVTGRTLAEILDVAAGRGYTPEQVRLVHGDDDEVYAEVTD